MKFILKVVLGVVLNAGALYAVIRLVDGVTYTGGIMFFVLGGIFVGLVNLFFKPILKAVSLPFIFITGGLFLIVINGAVLWVLSYFLDVIQFRDVALVFPNLGSYAIGALVFGIVNWFENLILK